MKKRKQTSKSLILIIQMNSIIFYHHRCFFPPPDPWPGLCSISPNIHILSNRKARLVDGNHMQFTIRPGLRRSCRDVGSQRSSPLVHKHTSGPQAWSLPSKCVSRGCFQPTNSEVFHLKDRFEKVTAAWPPSPASLRQLPSLQDHY